MVHRWDWYDDGNKAGSVLPPIIHGLHGVHGVHSGV